MRKNPIILTIFSLVLAALMLSSCSFRPKPVTIRNYVIDSGNKIAGQIKPLSKPFPYTLILPPVMGALPFRTQKILYRSSEITLSPYLYSRWEYAPTHMLMVKMLKTLDRANIFKSVAYRATGAHGNLYLETTLFDFSHHVNADGKTSFGVVSVMFQLIDGKTRDIIGTKSWVIRKPSPTLDAQGAAQALDAATNDLCLKLIQWLRETLQGLPAQP